LIILGDGPLTLVSLEQIARGRTKVELGDSARARIAESTSALRSLAASGLPIYGVNTGFGIFADRRIRTEQAADLSRNLILSHSVGVGPPLAPEVVRAAMIIRANTLAQGYSGVRVALVERLLQMLNASVTPIIPSKGSLGASGDLAPLSHLALVLTKDESEEDENSGRAWYNGEALSGAEAMRRAGLERLRLGPKEGLALNNGASFSTAQLALSALEIHRSLRVGELIRSLHALRENGFPAGSMDQPPAPSGRQAEQAALPSALLREAHTLDAVWDVLQMTEDVLQREMNAATDNPLIFGEQALSGGNFHGQPIALAADSMKRALVDAGYMLYCRISESSRPQAKADEPWSEYLTEAAIEFAGKFMAELRRLAHPDSIYSLPTSADQEDLNPNAWNASRRLSDAAATFRTLTAIGLLTTIRKIDPKDADIPEDLRTTLQPAKSMLAGCSSMDSLHNRVHELANAILKGEFEWES
jgi:histidine ammonia-lyase